MRPRFPLQEGATGAACFGAVQRGPPYLLFMGKISFLSIAANPPTLVTGQMVRILDCAGDDVFRNPHLMCQLRSTPGLSVRHVR